MIGLLSLIITVVLILIFIGMFNRLGRIEGILSKMAVHQGAMKEEETYNSKGHRLTKRS